MSREWSSSKLCITTYCICMQLISMVGVQFQKDMLLISTMSSGCTNPSQIHHVCLEWHCRQILLAWKHWLLCWLALHSLSPGTQWDQVRWGVLHQKEWKRLVIDTMHAFARRVLNLSYRTVWTKAITESLCHSSWLELEVNPINKRFQGDEVTVKADSKACSVFLLVLT